MKTAVNGTIPTPATTQDEVAELRGRLEVAEATIGRLLEYIYQLNRRIGETRDFISILTDYGGGPQQ